MGIMEPIWEDRSLRGYWNGDSPVYQRAIAEDAKVRVGEQTLSVSVRRPFNYYKQIFALPESAAGAIQRKRRVLYR